MKNQEKIFITATLFILVGILVNSYWRNNIISKNGVYVLGRVKKINDTENGLVYNFTYTFQGKRYDSHYKGFIKMQDSLIILKISTVNPHICKYIDQEIPRCLLNTDSIHKYWETFPDCK
jgi:hypothetical protein